MALSRRTFRVFVSSTFSDLKAERNALQRDVFPRLAELCARSGCRFQAIDLRWGIRDEAALDQRTLPICLDEVARCRRVSPRPNFILLLGDRYGWRPLPAEIPVDEFESLVRSATRTPPSSSAAAEAHLLAQWYGRDENALPPVYVLQPRTGEFVDPARWERVERRLHALLADAAARAPLEPAAREKYAASATEQEIVHGALGVADARDHVFAFVREIRGLPDDETAREYVDLDPDGRRDAEAVGRLAALHQRLTQALGDHVRRYACDWVARALTVEHVPRLCEDVYASLARVISAEVARLERVDEVDREAGEHEAFGRERARSFVGRAAELERLAAGLRAGGSRPLLVLGASGTGKSALVARAAEEARRALPHAQVVVRFIGATPASSDGRALLAGLCRELARRYGAVTDSGTEAGTGAFEELVREVPERLSLATAERPLLLFVDALDQLAPADPALRLAWLPQPLPQHVRLVLSALPEAVPPGLLERVPAEDRIPLEPMPSAEGRALLDVWLHAAGRALAPSQRAMLDRRIAGCGLPLFLKLAFEETRRSRSYEPAVDPGADVPAALRRLFARLGSDAAHGPVLVARALGYLAAARHGLAEDEFLHVLSLDPEVWGDFRARAHHEPPEERLPVAVWSRLFLDLEPYLMERRGDGAALLTFHHRQLGEAAAEEFLPSAARRARHAHLARYFAALPVGDVRRLSELPYQQRHAGLWKELEATLTDLEFVEAKCRAGLAYDLVSDYDRALGSDALPQEGRAEVEGFARFVRAETHVLARWPELSFQQAANQPGDSPPAYAARRRLETGGEARAWLEWADKPRRRSAAVLTLAGHAEVVSDCAWSPDGTRILSAGHDGTLRLWAANDGRELAVLTGHESFVSGCAWSTDGRRLVSAGFDRVLRVWDAVSGKAVAVLVGHEDVVTCVALSPDGRRVASGGKDGTLRLWDAEAGVELGRLGAEGAWIDACAFAPEGTRLLAAERDERRVTVWDVAARTPCFRLVGHAGWVWDCAVSPDGRRIVSVGEDGTVRVWDAETGVESAVLRGHPAAVKGCAWSPDGRRIATCGTAGAIRVWEAASGRAVACMDGPAATAYACAWSPDGRRLVSASGDGTLVVWDVEVACAAAPAMEKCPWGWNAACAPDGRRGVSRGGDKSVEVWDVATRRTLATLGGVGTGAELACHALAPDGARVATGGLDGSLRVWDATTGRETSSWRGGVCGVSACAWSPDGRRVAAATGDYVLRVFEGDGLRELGPLAWGAYVTGNVSISPDGRWIAAGAYREAVRVWDARTGAEVVSLRARLGAEGAWAWRPDAERLVAGGEDGRLRMWDVGSWREVASVEAHAGSIYACVGSPDGSRFATGGRDQVVRVWEGEPPRVRLRFPCGGRVTSLAFVGHGAELLAGVSGSGVVLRLHGVELGAPLVTAVRRDGALGVTCPACGALREATDLLDRETTCPACGRVLRVAGRAYDADPPFVPAAPPPETGGEAVVWPI
ncbi:MAG: DUF4062 domain-containing protein [Planctomycetes bacterium]|nr:DUF4062 domain-containing protein [Planctomycetota bacterium]